MEIYPVQEIQELIIAEENSEFKTKSSVDYWFLMRLLYTVFVCGR